MLFDSSKIVARAGDPCSRWASEVDPSRVVCPFLAFLHQRRLIRFKIEEITSS